MAFYDEGMVTSGCLPIVAVGDFQGVTCIDIPIDTLFSPIIDFHLGRLSYAFLIDSRGRVLLHPLLPKPENYKHEPIFLDMESVEISEATVSIKASMMRFVSVFFLPLRVALRHCASGLELRKLLVARQYHAACTVLDPAARRPAYQCHCPLRASWQI